MPLYNRLPLQLLKQTAYKYAPSVQAVPHLNVSSEVRDGRRYYQAINDDPQFLLRKEKSVRKSFGPGWYILRFRLFSSDAFEHRSNVYVDYGNGLVESEAVSCVVTGNNLATVVLKLNKRAKYIRFDPVSQQCEFRIDELRLVKVPAYLARHYVARWLTPHRGDLSGLSSSRVLAAIRNEASSQQQHPDSYLLGQHHGVMAQSQKGISYNVWMSNIEAGLIEDYKNKHALPGDMPLVSVIVPVYNAPAELLEQTIESVIEQSYSAWELCIADDASTDDSTVKVLTRYASSHPDKIKVKHLTENGHISAASNAALKMATGEFCLLLDHDDLLHPDAIDCLIRQLSVAPGAKIIYGDEDKVTEDNDRHSPHFKPDWNLDLITSQNYVCHPLMIKKSVLDEIDGFRLGVEGSQDHDLILRASLVVKETSIRHVPLVLYHWRETENSTASNSGAKSYTTDAGILALENYFALQDKPVAVTMGKFPNTYHCKWPVPENAPLVSLIIPTRDGYELVKQCVDSIFKLTTYPNFEIIIVDNQTTCEKTLGLFKRYQSKYQNVSVIRWDAPFNYSAINNYAVAHCNGDVVGLINNDIEVITPEWLDEMVGHALRPDVGCVGAKLYYPNDTVQHAGVILGIGGVAGHSHKYFTKNDPGYFTRLYLTQNLSAVTAAALVVRKDVFEQVGGLNEFDLKVAFNDVDFCLKVREAGYKNVFTPWAELYHHESVSRGQEDSAEKIARFNSEVNYMKNQWGELLNNDPAYNPNLTMQYEDFSM